jgi:shikimate kinase
VPEQARPGQVPRTGGSPTTGHPKPAPARGSVSRPVPLPIVLVGPMGAGKSRVGGRLAASVGAPFVDTDQRIIERYGPIDQIFAREGEEYFRVIEREVVAEALREDAVVSLGGGAVLDADTRDDLAGLAVVWLQVSPETVGPRLAGGTRPLLDEGGLDRWIEIMQARRPLYEAVAGLAIDTSRRSVARIVDEITEWAGARA